MLVDRIEAAGELYRAGKVDKLLLSGDRGVFGVDSAILVTQRFHLARALYSAHCAGLDATGYAADHRSYGRVLARLRLREALARVKVIADSLAGADPRFLGPRLPITGDGRGSWGPA